MSPLSLDSSFPSGGGYRIDEGVDCCESQPIDSCGIPVDECGTPLTECGTPVDDYGQIMVPAETGEIPQQSFIFADEAGSDGTIQSEDAASQNDEFSDVSESDDEEQTQVSEAEPEVNETNPGQSTNVLTPSFLQKLRSWISA